MAVRARKLASAIATLITAGIATTSVGPHAPAYAEGHSSGMGIVDTWHQVAMPETEGHLTTIHRLNAEEVLVAGGRVDRGSDARPGPGYQGAVGMKALAMRCTRQACTSLSVPDAGQINALSGTSDTDLWAASNGGM